MSRPTVTPGSSWRPLGKVAESIFVGLAPSRREPPPGNRSAVLPVINARDLADGRLAPAGSLEVRRLPSEDAADRYRVRRGDIVLTCRGTLLKLALVPPEADGAVLSSNLIAIRCGPDLAAPVLLAFLDSPRGRAALLGDNRTSTVGLGLSPASVARIEVPVPTREAGQRIAELVDAADRCHAAAIDSARLRRALAREVAMSMLVGPANRGPSRRR
ncbi:MAG: hypothetical protein FJ087_22930 [Deltaproteobacteria bacterium]|nr:hypothetical protein [Deltaproteobacteria bacterium]